MKSKGLKNLDRTCLVILVAVTLGGAALNTSVIVRHKRQLQQNAESRVQALSMLEQATRSEKALSHAIGQVQQELLELNKRIPRKTDMGALLKHLNLRMKERRITMASIQPQRAVFEDLAVKIPVRMVFQGAFLQSYLFLYDLETMEQLLVPEKVTITGSKTPQKSQVDLTVLVFERKNTGTGG